MIITKQERAKTSNRVNVYVDNEYKFSVEENTLVKYNLFREKPLTPEEIEQIVNYDLVEYGYIKAIEYISRRPHSEQEIRRKIEKKLQKKLKNAVQKDILNGIIDRLKRNRHIDDKDFTQWLVKSRKRQNKKSRREIEQELKKFGILKNVYRPILDELISNETEQETVSRLVQKKLNTSKMQQYSKQERTQKIIEYLSRKGFKWDEIKKAINN